MPIAPAVLTGFEIQVRRLRLTEETYVSSLPLRSWCEQNRNRVYIPEWLLHKWGLTVDADNSGTA